MSKVDKNKVDALIHRIGLKYNMTDQEIKKIVQSQFLFTYSELGKLDLKTVEQEDLDNIKANFLYRAFGRLYICKTLLQRRMTLQKNCNNINFNNQRWKNKN